MPTACHAQAIGRNLRGAGTGIKNAVLGNTSDLLVSFFKGLWPSATWKGLARSLGLSERTAKHRLARTRDFSADELAALIRSDHGFDVLAIIMADAAPAWW